MHTQSYSQLRRNLARQRGGMEIKSELAPLAAAMDEPRVQTSADPPG